MKQYSTKQMIPYIRQFLAHYPLFFSFIRTQEAILFHQHLKMDRPILDYGCGDGYFAKVAFGGKKIDVGLDIKSSRISEAVKQDVYRKITIYDSNVIPYPNNSFKVVISNCVFEHLLHLDQSLNEISRILKPGGFLITSVMTDRWNDYLFGNKILGPIYPKLRRIDQQHYNLLSSKQWRFRFESVGFKIVKEIGYLSKTASLWNDISHYLSLYSLPIYHLSGKWVIYPEIYFKLGIDRWIANKIKFPIVANQSAALFYVLQRHKITI